MALRDLVVTALVFGALPYILRKPHYGILVWSWLSYMNPHRLTWSFAYSMPFAQIAALATFIAIVFNYRAAKMERLPVNALTVIWAAFLVWICVTTVFAIHTAGALDQLIKIGKIQLFTFLTILLINDREKLHQLLWVIVLSIAFFTVKGGLFTIRTGAQFIVWGPPGSFIEDNNALAVTCVILIPLMLYLRSTLTRAWARHAMLAAIFLTAVSAAGSYSRSAFVAAGTVALFLIWKSPRRVPILFGMVIALPLILMSMPQSWHDRMGTITEPMEEGSARNRLETWATSVNLANDRLTGGGLNPWSRYVYAAYGPSWIRGKPSTRNAHSIYFNVLAEHGWIGLILFLLVFYLAWREAGSAIRRTRDNEELAWAHNLGRMIQVSLIAYLSGGATLTLAYFDLPWHLVAIALILNQYIVKDQVPAAREQFRPGFAAPSPALPGPPEQRAHEP